MQVIRRRQPTQSGPSSWFTGTVWLDPIAIGPEPSLVNVSSVHFTPGARTAWHRHPAGQVLYVLEGEGRVQLRGGKVQAIRAGDAVTTSREEWHWHGAGPDTLVTHIAIQQQGGPIGETEWGEHVSDEEYRAEPER